MPAQTLGTRANFLAVAAEHSAFDTAAIAILPVPFEATTSYGKGTARGPAAILRASAQVEFYDDEFDRELVFERGIATMRPLPARGTSAAKMLAITEAAVRNLLSHNKFVATLGGEHTISIAPIRAHLSQYSALSVLHFDAHSDLRAEYQGTRYSHASALARVCETLRPDHLVQVGIRAQCRAEAEFIRNQGVRTFYASAIRRGLHGAHWQQEVVRALPTNEVYVTFDVDYFDPAIMPATGTPEPDGFLWNETMDVFRALRAAGKRIVGFDVVELAPQPRLHHCDLTTARLVYKILNFAL